MSTRQKFVKYAKLLSGYGIGTFLNQSINLILIPLFWRVLSPEEFGVIAVTQIVSLFLQPIYMFGISETIQRFYYIWTEEERPHYLGWIFWFLFAFTLFLSVFLDIIGTYFSKYLIISVPFSPLLRLTLWSTFLANFINIPIAISRIQQKVKTFNILFNGSFMTQIGLVYYLVAVKNLGPYGYVTGFFIANLIWFTPILFIIFKNGVIFPSRKYIHVPVKYAAPICFGGLFEGIGSTMDRYFLDKYLPLATIGFYNLARQFGSLVNIVNTVTKLVFVPYIYKVNALKKNAQIILGHLGLIYGVIMTAPVIAVCTLSHETIQILDPNGVYLKIVSYIPYFAISFYFLALATVLGRGMDLAGKTKWSFSIPLIGGMTSLSVYLYSLPEAGVWGILWGVLLGNIARSLANIVLAICYFPRKLYLKQLSVGLIFAICCYFLLIQIQISNPYLSILAKTSLLLFLLFVQIKAILHPSIEALIAPKKK